MIRVLIVDDHAVVRDGLARLLAEAGIEVVAAARDGDDGARLASEHTPDLVLWDLAMPGGGMVGLARLRQAVPESRVLVITALDDPWLAAEAARAGAHGFIAKTSSPAELVAAVRACVGGHLWQPPCPLSPREGEVFTLLGAGLPNREIAHRLGISVKTVESHLERLKEKLGCGSTAELRARAVRRGG